MNQERSLFQRVQGLDLHEIALWVFLLLMAVRVGFPESPVRWSIYLMPFILVGMVGFQWRVQGNMNDDGVALLKRYYVPLLAVHVLIVVVSLLALLNREGIITRYIEESVFFITPIVSGGLLFLLPRKSKPDRYLTLLLFGFIGLFWISIRFDVAAVLVTTTRVLEILLNADFTASKDIPTESNFAFPFGLLLICFLIRRKWLLALISTYFCAVNFKRITLFGIFIVTVITPIVLWLYRRFRMHYVVAVLLAAANITVVILTILLARGQFDTFFLDTIGMVPNDLLLGRPRTYNTLLDGFEIQGFAIPIIGIGLGSTTTYLEGIDYFLTQAHSTLLKHLLEFGPLVFLVWLLTLVYLNTRTGPNTVMLLSLNMFWLTGNTYILFEIMLLFYIIQSYFYLEHAEAHVAAEAEVEPLATEVLAAD